MSRFLRLAAALVVILMLSGDASAATRQPELRGPVDVRAGGLLVLTATTSRTGQSCRLQTTSPTGRRRSIPVDGLRTRPSGLRARTSKYTRPGLWELRLRCGRRSSWTLEIRVLARSAAGAPVGRSSVLVRQATTFSFSRTRPDGYRRPAADQDASGAPAFSPQAADGLGLSTPERASRALQWALGQVGRRDYALWCLRFVANAYNAPAAGYPTAQTAADALDLHDRGGSAASAPAGSLVFFRVDEPGGRSYGHVGISLGDGRMVSALETVRVERIADVRLWRQNYLGWAWAPAAWPGFPPTAPPAPAPPPIALAERPPTTSETLRAQAIDPAEPAPAQGSSMKIPIVVDNRVTAGMDLREDEAKAQLQSQPWVKCGIRGCRLEGERWASGAVLDGAVCQIQGEEWTNGSYETTADDANPELFSSTRYYGLQLPDGRFGYMTEATIAKEYRGGLGLPECPPPASPTPTAAPAAAPAPPPAAAPATPSPAPGDLAAPSRPAIRSVPVVVDNRVTDGASMREDSWPYTLQSRPWTKCGSRKCLIPGDEWWSGDILAGAVCQLTGDRWTNGDDSSAADDANPGLFESTRWYGLAVEDGRFGYLPEVAFFARYRGGLDLPTCPAPPDDKAAAIAGKPPPPMAAPTAEELAGP